MADDRPTTDPLPSITVEQQSCSSCGHLLVDMPRGRFFFRCGECDRHLAGPFCVPPPVEPPLLPSGGQAGGGGARCEVCDRPLVTGEQEAEFDAVAEAGGPGRFEGGFTSGDAYRASGRPAAIAAYIEAHPGLCFCSLGFEGDCNSRRVDRPPPPSCGRVCGRRCARGWHVTAAELQAIRDRDDYFDARGHWPPAESVEQSDRRALLAEVDRLRAVVREQARCCVCGGVEHCTTECTDMDDHPRRSALRAALRAALGDP